MSHAILVSRILLGATFLVFGANYFLAFIHFSDPAEPFDGSELEPGAYEVFVARRPR
jgi:hypothetical protein